MEIPMGIVNIDDDLHEQLRRASKVTFRSINAQAAYWIKVGMLFSSAGVSAPSLAMSEA
jgi:hypothetical protein